MIWALASLSLLLIGCGDSVRYYNLSGTVMYKGQPLPAGQIFFTADYTKGNDGMQGMAIIQDGKYDTRIYKKGVLGGPYKIKIDCYDGKPGNELPLGKLLGNAEFARDFPKSDSVQDFDVK
jgi:hypothetical protein